MLALNKMAALEAAPLGITVNTISPGATDTSLLRSVMPADMNAVYATSVPMSRIGRPEDVAAAALYLASESASFVTGNCLDVNGNARMQ